MLFRSLLLANCYYALGKIEEAAKSYEHCGVSDSRLKAAAFAGLASCEEIKNDYKSAAEHFQKAASASGTQKITSEYLLKSANDFGRSGDKSTALELYKRLKKEFPQSQEARDVERYIAEYAG